MRVGEKWQKKSESLNTISPVRIYEIKGDRIDFLHIKTEENQNNWEMYNEHIFEKHGEILAKHITGVFYSRMRKSFVNEYEKVYEDTDVKFTA